MGISAVSGSRWFVVRKQPPGPSEAARRVEGARLGPGVRALVVDDVVTTGGSLIEAINVVLATGAEVTAAAAVVDRGDLTKPAVQAMGVPFAAVCTYQDLGIDPVLPAG